MTGNAKLSLSPRELRILHMTAEGMSAKQIAQQLKIAPRTVEHHLDHARRKTGTNNRVHMVAYALQAGLLVM